jgi:hypothetical protein
VLEADVDGRKAIFIITPPKCFLDRAEVLAVFEDDDSVVVVENVTVSKHELKIDSPSTVVVEGSQTQFDPCVPVTVPNGGPDEG